ncbi:MAG TPA: flagellar hook-associated protein FlgL [Bacillota bacterium]|jgi:flagellar hook-associated protein 3 FlgL|nr:flagellar hook-associated protein FlgL [Bacillota bacterium]HOL10354.1 flagellar hook-associated protein FlgL [Bacillota bacterium]HPO97358.1 flagellar hook-associated protein FlgL [Bacillota bacterium]
MRVTEKMISNGLSRNINKTMSRIDKKYSELSSGKRIQRPSDDPVALVTSLRLYDSIKEADRYKENAQNAISWLEASDAALGELTSVLHRFEEVAVAASNGTLTRESREGLAAEIRELKNHILQIANTQHERRYLFSGQQTIRPAYDQNFKYQGDSRRFNIEVGADTYLEVSVTGDEVFGDFFEKLDQFATHVDAGDIVQVSNVDIKEIQSKLDQVLDIRASLGAKVNRLEKNVDRLELLNIQFNQLLSKNEDVDIAGAAMELKMQESVYQAALATGARILQITLVNYLR